MHYSNGKKTQYVQVSTLNKDIDLNENNFKEKLKSYGKILEFHKVRADLIICQFINSTISTQCVVDMDKSDELNGQKYIISLLPDYKWNELTNRNSNGSYKINPIYALRILPIRSLKEMDDVIHFSKRICNFQIISSKIEDMYLDLGLYNDNDVSSIYYY